MFDLEQFTADCRAALAADSSHRLVREVVARAVSDPSAVLKGIGEPKRSEVQKLYHAPDLTILNVIWGPMMTIMPHNHQMWAVIGIYTGREDNVFWRRLPDGNGKVEAAGARALCVGDAEPLGHNIIHSVTNPIPRLTGAIHVYGGDFFAAERSEWGPGKLARRSLRYSKKHEVIRRRECANETLCGKAKLESFRIVSARVRRWPAAEIARAAR
jgi:predicted metal-dependent enzyme (double-stranded beta helix superfamily)